MKIILNPQRRDDKLEVVKNGEVLTVNGEDFDFSPLQDGMSLPSSAVDCEWFAGDIQRINGELVLTILLPHGPNPTQEQAFPVPLENVVDGFVKLPEGVSNED